MRACGGAVVLLCIALFWRTLRGCHNSSRSWVVTMLGNQMLTVRDGALVEETVLRLPVWLEEIHQLLSTHHAFAIICMQWSWVGFHTLACEVSQPTS